MKQIQVERSIWIATPRERVWQPIVNPAEIAQWPLDDVQKEDERLQKLGATFTQKLFSQWGWTATVTLSRFPR
jgi:uncharacterized protein YndB with AHSA1/START domain